MQAITREVIIYQFTKEERNHLMGMGVWSFITSRLRNNEQIEIVNE